MVSDFFTWKEIPAEITSYKFAEKGLGKRDTEFMLVKAIGNTRKRER